MVNRSSNQLLVLLLLMVSNIQASQAPDDETKATAAQEWLEGWLRAERKNDLRGFVSALPDFHRAVWDGNRETITSLLANPATDPNQVAEDLNITPLSTAAVSGQDEIITLLLAHPRINVNQTNEDGDTALYIATRHKREGVVRLLVADPRTDVNHARKKGSTALFKAACDGSHGIIRLLIRHGAQNLQCSPPEGSFWDGFPGLSCLEAANDDETRQLMTQLWAEQSTQQQQNADDDDDEELT